MKARAPEAARLEADYLARVRTALAGRSAEEIAEVVESIQMHIDESTTDAGATGMEITLTQMAQVVEQLGPPDAYRDPDAGTRVTPEPAVPGAPGIPAPPPTGAPPAGEDFVNKPFEIGACFADAMNLCTRNFLPL